MTNYLACIFLSYTHQHTTIKIHPSRLACIFSYPHLLTCSFSCTKRNKLNRPQRYAKILTYASFFREKELMNERRTDEGMNELTNERIKAQKDELEPVCGELLFAVCERRTLGLMPGCLGIRLCG